MNRSLIKLTSLSLLIFILFSCTNKHTAYREIETKYMASYKKWKSRSQTNTGEKADLSLHEAIDIAFSYNKKMLAILQQKAIASGKMMESFSNFLPKLNAFGGYTRLDEEPFIGDKKHKTIVGYRDNYALSFGLSQPIFHAGEIVSGYNASSLFSCITDENINSHYQRLYSEVAKSYFDILLHEKLFEVQTQSIKTASNHLQEVKIKLEQGHATKYDILRAEVEVSNFEAEMIKYKNRLSLSKTTFLKFLGKSGDFNFVLDDLLAYHLYQIDQEEAVYLAYRNRPDLKAKYLEVKMQKEIVNIARSQYYPKVDSSFDYKIGRPDPHMISNNEWGTQWNVRLGLSWDILDFGRKRGKLKQEKANLKLKEFLLSDTTESIILEVKQALYNLQDADEFVKSQSLDLKRAKAALKLAEIGYTEGIKTEVDVSDAISAMTRSQSLYYQALYQHNMARFNMLLAMGMLQGE